MANDNTQTTENKIAEPPALLPTTPRPRTRARRGPLRQVRLALAISAGKLVGASGRILGIGGGTSLPGMVARRIDPDVLKTVMGASTAKKIVITGSNGKTTTSRMIAAMGKESRNHPSPKRSCSNLLQ